MTTRLMKADPDLLHGSGSEQNHGTTMSIISSMP